MKNLFYFLPLIFIVLIGCESEDVTSLNTEVNLEKQSPAIVLEKEAFPGQGEFVDVGNGLKMRKINDSTYVYGLDMIITKEQLQDFDIVLDPYNTSDTLKTRGTVITNTKYRWPNKTICYSFNSNVPLNQLLEITSAVNVWREQTQLQFVRRSNEKDYVEFVISDGNGSRLGKVGGRQYIYLYPDSYIKQYAIHEIGHAAGMIHEHQNFSRDTYIVVHMNNIITDYQDQFTKQAPGSYGQSIHAHTLYDRGYPFSSLMMYPSYNSFAIDQSLPTMTIKTPPPPIVQGNPFVTGNTWVNQSRYLTASDRAAVANLYGYHYDPATDTTLTDEMKGIF